MKKWGVVRHSRAACSSPTGIRVAASRRGRVHEVVIMIDLSDLRKRTWPADLVPLGSVCFLKHEKFFVFVSCFNEKALSGLLTLSRTLVCDMWDD